METNRVKSHLISFAGKSIPRERVVYFWAEEHITFPFIRWDRPTAYCLIAKYPYYRRWLYSDSLINWITKHSFNLKLDTGEILTQYYYNEGPGGYGSGTNCERAMAEFNRNYYQ